MQSNSYLYTYKTAKYIHPRKEKLKILSFERYIRLTRRHWLDFLARLPEKVNRDWSSGGVLPVIRKPTRNFTFPCLDSVLCYPGWKGAHDSHHFRHLSGGNLSSFSSARLAVWKHHSSWNHEIARFLSRRSHRPSTCENHAISTRLF